MRLFYAYFSGYCLTAFQTGSRMCLEFTRIILLSTACD